MFYDEQGESGKGPLLEAISALVGKSNIANLNLVAFEDRYSLANIIDCQWVLGDENPVKAFYADLTKLKSLITRDGETKA